MPTRLEAATARKAAAIKGREALLVPSERELRDAFRALHPREQDQLLIEIPSLPKFIAETNLVPVRSGLSL